MIQSKRIDGCRVCGGADLHLILDYGRTALANRFLKAEQLADPEPTFPLRLVLCRGCGLVQIDETVEPSALFGDYVYVSGTSDLIHRHAARLAENAVERFGLKPDDLVLEAASNDGTVLRAFQQRGVRTLGVEPAVNLTARANLAGIETIGAFFNESTARYVLARSGPAKLVLARHVLAHAANLAGFVRGIETVLAPDGVAVVEVPHLLPFFNNLEYDTVYHEHLCYFSVRALEQLGTRFGLELIDAEEVAIHGGSVLATFQRAGGPRWASPAVESILSREALTGLHRVEPWQGFAAAVETSRAGLRASVGRLRRSGRTLAGYGAAAKAMTLLAYAGIGPDELPYVVDRSPHKQGLFTPGHHIPVLPPSRLLHDRPDAVLLLAWNFAEEIMEQQAEYRRLGGRFLLPIPAPRWADEAAAPRVEIGLAPGEPPASGAA